MRRSGGAETQGDRQWLRLTCGTERHSPGPTDAHPSLRDTLALDPLVLRGVRETQAQQPAIVPGDPVTLQRVSLKMLSTQAGQSPRRARRLPHLPRLPRHSSGLLFLLTHTELCEPAAHRGWYASFSQLHCNLLTSEVAERVSDLPRVTQRLREPRKPLQGQETC